MNQRIEASWWNFKSERLGWWKHFLQNLLALELFDPSDPVQVDCLRFCFIEWFREEVTEVATAWNQHIISHHKNGGLTEWPDIMFFLPQTNDTIDHLHYVRDENIDKFQGIIGQLPVDFSDDFHFISLIRKVSKCLSVY